MLWRETCSRSSARTSGSPAGSCGRAPASLLTAVATLALGIGATTAIFSVVNGVVVSGLLPFAAPERLVRAYFVSQEGEKQAAFSVANFLDWRAASHHPRGRRHPSTAAP